MAPPFWIYEILFGFITIVSIGPASPTQTHKTIQVLILKINVSFFKFLMQRRAFRSFPVIGQLEYTISLISLLILSKEAEIFFVNSFVVSLHYLIDRKNLWLPLNYHSVDPHKGHLGKLKWNPYAESEKAGS